MDVNPEKTALVLIEYQNDFTSEGGALHGAVDEVMQETGMLENSRRVAGEARRAGATVVHAPISFAPGYGELGNPDKVYGILKGVIDSNALFAGDDAKMYATLAQGIATTEHAAFVQRLAAARPKQ